MSTPSTDPRKHSEGRTCLFPSCVLQHTVPTNSDLKRGIRCSVSSEAVSLQTRATEDTVDLSLRCDTATLNACFSKQCVFALHKLCLLDIVSTAKYSNEHTARKDARTIQVKRAKDCN
eukprot:1799788-Amphidinium_carterae.1